MVVIDIRHLNHTQMMVVPVETKIVLSFNEIEVITRERIFEGYYMYFDSFPVIPYDAKGDLDYKDVTNLLLEELV